MDTIITNILDSSLVTVGLATAGVLAIYAAFVTMGLGKKILAKIQR